MREHRHYRAGLIEAPTPGAFRFKTLFSAPKPPKVEPLPPPPVTTDPAVTEAERMQREEARRRRGRASTILTDTRQSGQLDGGSSAGRTTTLGGAV